MLFQAALLYCEAFISVPGNSPSICGLGSYTCLMLCAHLPPSICKLLSCCLMSRNLRRADMPCVTMYGKSDRPCKSHTYLGKGNSSSSKLFEKCLFISVRTQKMTYPATHARALRPRPMRDVFGSPCSCSSCRPMSDRA
jgi:hypothetical protein